MTISLVMVLLATHREANSLTCALTDYVVTGLTKVEGVIYLDYRDLCYTNSKLYLKGMLELRVSRKG